MTQDIPDRDKEQAPWVHPWPGDEEDPSQDRDSLLLLLLLRVRAAPCRDPRLMKMINSEHRSEDQDQTGLSDHQTIAEEEDPESA